jgi:outer membrane receptor protein involved in Fe transport
MMNSKAAARPSRLRRSLLASGIAISIVAVGAPIAFAQVAEVVVTARKREENVQNIPVAVTALSGKDIQKFNISSIQDVATQTPQLVIARGSSGSGADISLRGIGSSSENIGIEQSVSVNIDGIYYGQGRAIEESTFDVSGVQVLKGPQALFYGKNATAGALAIQTNDPGSKYEGSLTGGYEFNAHEPYVEGFVSGPVTDTFGLRMAFRYSDQTQGYLKNTATVQNYNTFDSATGLGHSNPTATPSDYLGENKNLLLRLTGKWTPTSRLTVTGKITYNQLRANNNSDNSVAVYCPLGIPQSEVGLANPNQCGKHFSAAQPALPLVLANQPHSLFSLANGQDFERYQDANAYLRVNYQGDNITLTSTSAYQHLFNDWADNQNFTGAAEVYAAEHFVWSQFSTEERATTSFHFPVNFAGGVYFQTTHLQFAQDVDFAGAQNSAAPPLDEYIAYNKSSATTGHTYAIFGQAIWDIVKNVELTAGARYTHEIKSSYFRQPYVWPPLYGIFVQYDPANPATSVGAHQVFGNWSPEVTLTYKPSSNVTVYGAYKTGYKSGGFSNSAILSTGTLPGDLQFKPETAKGFEGGVKTILLDHQLRLNVDAFDYLYSNLQVDFFNTPTFNYITLNAASARTYGVEAEAEFAPKAMPGLTLHAEGAYDDSHYDTFEAPCSPAGITYEQGCNALRVVNPNNTYQFSPNCGTAAVNCNFMNVNGRPTALAPKWTAVFGGDYTHPVSSTMKLGLTGNMRVSSGYIANGFPSGVAEQVDYQPSYVTFDAVISLASINDRWNLSLIGRNLTNAFIETGTQGLPLSGGTTGCRVSACGAQIISDQGAIVQNPRTVAIQLNVRY